MSATFFLEPFWPLGSWKWLALTLLCLILLVWDWWYPRFRRLSVRGQLLAVAVSAIAFGAFFWWAPGRFPGVSEAPSRVVGGARPDVRLDPAEFYVWFDTWTLEVEFTNYGDRVADVGYVTVQASSSDAIRAVLPFRSLAPGETMRLQATLLEVGDEQPFANYRPTSDLVTVVVGGCYIFEGANLGISPVFVNLKPKTKRISASRPVGLSELVLEDPPESCLELGPRDLVMMTPLNKVELRGE